MGRGEEYVVCSRTTLSSANVIGQYLADVDLKGEYDEKSFAALALQSLVMECRAARGASQANIVKT